MGPGHSMGVVLVYHAQDNEIHQTKTFSLHKRPVTRLTRQFELIPATRRRSASATFESDSIPPLVGPPRVRGAPRCVRWQPHLKMVVF